MCFLKLQIRVGQMSVQANIFWPGEATEKLQTPLESWNIEDSKDVRDCYVALTIQKLWASKVGSGFLSRVR